MASLAEAFPVELARVRQVKEHFLAIGPAGAIGAAFIEADIRAAEAAMASGDIVEMVRSYQKLKEIED